MPACPDCGSHFVRREHLTRHRTTVHASTVAYVCPICHRSFNRSDSFHRHRRCHAAVTPDQPSDPLLLRTRVPRACRPCASARARCSAGRPCARCINRGIACDSSYPGSGSRTVTCNGIGQAHVGSAQTLSRPERATIGNAIVTQSPDDSGIRQAPGCMVSQAVNAHHQRDHLEPTSDFYSDVLSPNNNNIFRNYINWTPVVAVSAFDPILPGNEQHVWQGDPRSTNNNPNASVLSPNGDGSAPSPSLAAPSIANTSFSLAATPSLNYGQSAHRSRELQTDSPDSGLYVDGHGARKPRPQLVTQTLVDENNDEDCLIPPYLPVADEDGLIFEFPSAVCSPGSQDPAASVTRVDSVIDSTYQSVLHMFELLAERDSLFYRAFRSSRFPSSSFFKHCVRAYISHVEREIPVIHATVWSRQAVPWLTVLAAAATGSLFCPVDGDGGQTSASLVEFLRRSVRYSMETRCASTETLSHACLINLFIAIFTGDDRNEAIYPAFLELINVDLTYKNTSFQELESAFTEQQAWDEWISRETRRRCIYFGWQICILSHFNMVIDAPPWLPLHEWSLHIPCPPAMWEATSFSEWQKHRANKDSPLRMKEALESLFISRKVPLSCHRSSSTPLIYGVLHQVIQIGHHLRHPLEQWKPVAQPDVQTTHRVLSEQIEWLPANQSYAAWRNGACDCLDLIHWQAHIEIAKAAGFEDTKVLHLHLARLLLLTPCKEVMAFACGLELGTPNLALLEALALDRDKSEDEVRGDPSNIRSIRRWLTLDDHKGRLSIVHAGAMFWHIQRFSKRSAYTPFSLFLSTLVLWLYGVFQPHIRATLIANKAALSQLQRLERHSNYDGLGVDYGKDGEDVPVADSTITVDRPCDDETVQLFVLHGHIMKPMVFRTIELCSREGGRRVLEHGIKLLGRCKHSEYSRAGYYQSVLAKVLEWSTEIDPPSAS